MQLEHHNNPTEGRASQRGAEAGAGPELRNVHGQSLDDARAAFRAEWQAKVDRKRHEAARAQEKARRWASAPQKLLLGGAVLGGLGGVYLGVSTGAFRVLPALILALALSGCGLVIPLAAAATACATRQKQRADQLEREAQRLERS